MQVNLPSIRFRPAMLSPYNLRSHAVATQPNRCRRKFVKLIGDDFAPRTHEKMIKAVQQKGGFVPCWLLHFPGVGDARTHGDGSIDCEIQNRLETLSFFIHAFVAQKGPSVNRNDLSEYLCMIEKRRRRLNTLIVRLRGKNITDMT